MYSKNNGDEMKELCLLNQIIGILEIQSKDMSIESIHHKLLKNKIKTYEMRIEFLVNNLIQIKPNSKSNQVTSVPLKAVKCTDDIARIAGNQKELLCLRQLIEGLNNKHSTTQFLMV